MLGNEIILDTPAILEALDGHNESYNLAARMAARDLRGMPVRALPVVTGNACPPKIFVLVRLRAMLMR
jgi:hypothetical protein